MDSGAFVWEAPVPIRHITIYDRLSYAHEGMPWPPLSPPLGSFGARFIVITRPERHGGGTMGA